MKKVVVLGLVLAVALLTGYGSMVRAAEGSGTEQEAPKNAVKVTVTGMNYCVEAALKKAGETPKLGIDANRHALKVKEAIGEDGEAIARMKGRTLHYLYSETSAALSSDEAYFGKPLEITGTLYRNESVIEVTGVEVLEEDLADLLGEDDELDFAEFDYSSGGGSASSQR